MTVGTVAAATMVLLNEASVLYTFYAPLQAHWIFYVGMALVVVGSWIGGIAQIMKYVEWRKANPGQPSPLITFMVVVNLAMWIICSLGVAVEVVFQLITMVIRLG